MAKVLPPLDSLHILAKYLEEVEWLTELTVNMLTIESQYLAPELWNALPQPLTSLSLHSISGYDQRSVTNAYPTLTHFEVVRCHFASELWQEIWALVPNLTHLSVTSCNTLLSSKDVPLLPPKLAVLHASLKNCSENFVRLLKVQRPDVKIIFEQY